MQEKENIPLVSIAVATFNGGKYLAQQLDTLVNQTYKNLEIIVSDDGSTDHTLETLKQYAEKYSNFFVYSNGEPHGVKRNFENALKHCKGTYIAFSDQDDVWMLDKIEKLVNNIGDAALIYHDSLFIDFEGNSLERTFQTNLNCYAGSDSRAFLFCNCVSGHALLFHRKMLDIALPFPEARHHDWWLAFRAADNGGIKFLDEVLVHYRQHPASQTDFLQLKTKKFNKKKVDKEDIDWFEACATAPGKHKRFFEKWLKAYTERDEHFWNRRMFSMRVGAMKPLFFMRKKSRMSTFLFIVRTSWGEHVKTGFRTRKQKLLKITPKDPNDLFEDE